MHKRQFLLATLALALGATPGRAHAPRIGPRGGALVDAGVYHVEVLAKEKILEVYVSDINDKPLKATGFKAVGILVSNGQSIRVPLVPTPEGDKLVGSAEAPLAKRIKGAIQLTAPDGTTSVGKVN